MKYRLGFKENGVVFEIDGIIREYHEYSEKLLEVIVKLNIPVPFSVWLKLFNIDLI